MEVADGVILELFAGWAGSIEVRQAADAMALEAAMQSRASEMRDGGLESVEAIVEREQSAFAEGDNDGFFIRGESGGTRLLRSHGSVIDAGTPPPLLDRLGVAAPGKE